MAVQATPATLALVERIRADIAKAKARGLNIRSRKFFHHRAGHITSCCPLGAVIIRRDGLPEFDERHKFGKAEARQILDVTYEWLDGFIEAIDHPLRLPQYYVTDYLQGHVAGLLLVTELTGYKESDHVG